MLRDRHMGTVCYDEEGQTRYFLSDKVKGRQAVNNTFQGLLVWCNGVYKEAHL